MDLRDIKNSRAVGIGARLLVSVAIISLIIFKFDELRNIDVRSIISATDNTLLAILSIIGVYLLMSVVFVIPASIVYISVGLAFPLCIAIPVNIAGIFCQLCSTYTLGRFLGGEAVIKKLKKIKYGEKIISLQGKNSISALLAVRFLPVFPIGFVSLFLGSVRTNFAKYIIISLAGILPRVILFTILGDGIYDYIPIDKLIIIVGVLVPVALVVWVVSYIVKTYKKSK